MEYNRKILPRHNTPCTCILSSIAFYKTMYKLENDIVKLNVA